MTSAFFRAGRLSVRAKINLTLLVVFALVLISSIWYTDRDERDLTLHVVEQQTRDAADAFFDGINTMMITGTMANRRVLRDKLLSRAGVVDARIVRSDAVKSSYGKGFAEEQPVDALDRRALNGEKIMRVEHRAQGRVLTVIDPLRASRSYRGTNCLTCHHVPQGTVLGAVRVSYSLQALDKRVSANLFASGVMQSVLFALGLLLMAYVLRRVVTRPINDLHTAIEAIERDSDLDRRVDVRADDEIGAVAGAFNKMQDKFRTSLQQVSASTQQLASVASRIAAISEETVNAAGEQRSGTDSVATAMNETEAAVQEVARNASATAQASQGARQAAGEGALVASEALGGIEVLVKDIENAAQAIKELDSKTENVTMVVEVITQIAEQTNMLALNAAIEAARAGEQGRGFTVVAEEVRTLAGRTHESTQDIHQIIEDLRLGARNAVTLMETARQCAQQETEQVERSAEALGLIAGEVVQINDMNTQIATSAEEQSQVAEDINRNVNKISQIADNTLEGARQTASVSEELVRLSGQLDELVGRFKFS